MHSRTLGLVFRRYVSRWLLNVFDSPDTSINDGYSNLTSYLSKFDTIDDGSLLALIPFYVMVLTLLTLFI